MKLLIDFEKYSFDSLELSTGKIYFEFSDGTFPDTELAHFVDCLLQDWMKGMIHLLTNLEVGDYHFTFDDFCHDWIVELVDKKNVNLFFRKDEKNVKSFSCSLDEIVGVFSDCVRVHLENCKSLNYTNDELRDLKSDFEQYF